MTVRGVAATVVLPTKEAAIAPRMRLMMRAAILVLLTPPCRRPAKKPMTAAESVPRFIESSVTATNRKSGLAPKTATFGARATCAAAARMSARAMRAAFFNGPKPSRVGFGPHGRPARPWLLECPASCFARLSLRGRWRCLRDRSC